MEFFPEKIVPASALPIFLFQDAVFLFFHTFLLFFSIFR